MEHSRAFMKGRAIAFSCTTLIAFTFATLLIILLSLRWNVSSGTERAAIAAFLTIDLITVFVLPVLLLVRFRPWLDAARLAALLIFHLALASLFSALFAGVPCADASPDGQGLCAFFNVLILMASWVVPALLLAYGGVLAWYARRTRGQTWAETDDDETVVSHESKSKEKHSSRAFKAQSYQPWRPYSATAPTKPALTISIPPPTINPNLPVFEPYTAAPTPHTHDRRSPFAPRPPPTTRARASSTSTSTTSRPRASSTSSARPGRPHSQPPAPRPQSQQRPRSQPPPARRERRQTMPSPAPALHLHDGDRVRTGAELALAAQKRRSSSAPRKSSTPSALLMPGAAREGSYASTGSVGVSPATQFTTWGWGAKAPGHKRAASSVERSPTSTITAGSSGRRPSVQLLDEKPAARLVKQPDVAL